MRSNLPSPGIKYVYKCMLAVIAYILFEHFIIAPYPDEPVLRMIQWGIVILFILWALDKI